MKTVANMRDSVSGMLQGLNLNNVTNLYVAFERVARQLVLELSIPETIATQQFSLYDGVTDYQAPADMFATGIVDIRQQGTSRSPTDSVQKQYIGQWDRSKNWVSQGTKMTVEYDKGTGVLRVASSHTIPRIEIDPMTETTGWTADGVVVSGLTTDVSTSWRSPSSLMLTATIGTGTITKTITSTDLTSYQTFSKAFLAFYAPDISDLAYVTLKIGSSASNYYQMQASTGTIRPFTSGLWQLASFDMETKTTVGTPDITKMTYAQVGFTSTGTIYNLHVGGLWFSLPSPHELLYPTDAIFLPSGSTTPIQTITNNSDSIILNNSAYAIYEVKCAIEVSLQQGGSLSSGIMNALIQRLHGSPNTIGMMQKYRADNPAQELRTVGSYYSTRGG